MSEHEDEAAKAEAVEAVAKVATAAKVETAETVAKAETVATVATVAKVATVATVDDGDGDAPAPDRKPAEPVATVAKVATVATVDDGDGDGDGDGDAPAPDRKPAEPVATVATVDDGDATAPDRKPAELTIGGALRCYLDQLPPDRCVLCSAGGAIVDDASGFALCQHHRQKPRVPALLGIVLTASTTVFTVLHGTENLMQSVCGFLLAAACFGIARSRHQLRKKLGVVPPGTSRVELQDVAPDVARAVVALGARPYRKALPPARARARADSDAD